MEKQLQVERQEAEKWHGEGISLYWQERFEDALSCIERALSLWPDFPEALNSKGFLLQDLGRNEAACECFAQAVQLAPGLSMARLNLGMAQLKLGDWGPGWDNYEARWHGSAEAGQGSLQPISSPLPLWEGQGEIAHQRLLVITEQGFGDTFQFSRFLALARQRFGRVGFACSQPTLRLMEWSYGAEVALFSTLPAGYESQWDWYCPLLSLPRALSIRLANVPAATPYLRVSPALQAYWADRLAQEAPGRFRVGIAWAGRRSHMNDRRRSLSLAQLSPLLADQRVTWVSLQKWAPEDERPEVPTPCDWLDWTEELEDFGATAALVANLDLVISIDSSMVHLAGALGRPVWMLDRFDNEWRWLTGRTDSPWYPSLRIFRQPSFGDWAGALAPMKAALAELELPEVPPRRAECQPSASPRATPADPDSTLSTEAAMALAGQYHGAGRLQEAEVLLRRILAAQPGYPHALHLLGVIAWQSGQPQLAIDLIKQALAGNEAAALFHSNLGEMYRQLGHVAEAIGHGRRAVEIDPAMAMAHGNLGVACFDAGDLDAAEACHQRALALVPGLVSSLNNLGSIARARKNLGEAADWYRRALESQPGYLESLVNLGVVLREAGHLEEASAMLEQALRLRPDAPEALCALGQVRAAQGKAAEADILLRRVLALQPGYGEAQLALSRLVEG